jgi:class 3 adenylate cyclase
MYKFIGDGWILLFPLDITGDEIVNFLKELSIYYDQTMKSRINPYLEQIPEATGLTFGIEKGPLMKSVMLGKKEFLGRALNIACRLQNAVKAKGGYPEYRVLVSNQVYNEYLRKARGLKKAVRVYRVLSNIRDGAKYRCVKIKLN